MISCSADIMNAQGNHFNEEIHILAGKYSENPLQVIFFFLIRASFKISIYTSQKLNYSEISDKVCIFNA